MTKGTNLQRTAAAFLVGAGLVLAASSAHAQVWLADRSAAEGAGLRVGDFELHPGIGGEVGYDSNWFLRTSKTGAQFANGAPTAPVRDAGEFRLTPSLSLSTLGAQRSGGPSPTAQPPIIFRTDLSATYRTFIGSAEIRDQSSNLSADGAIRATIAPGKPWSFTAFATEQRIIQPNALGNPDLSYNSDVLGVGAELISRPNSGTLDMRVGYALLATLYEDSAGVPFDSTSHDISLKGRWAFRPQTAFVSESSASFDVYSDQARQNTELHDSTPVRSRIGLTGLVTNCLSATVMAGWGASFFRPNTINHNVEQFDSVIGNAQMTYKLASNPRDEPGAASLTLSSVTLGFSRDFQNSLLSDYYTTDRGYLRFNYMFAGRLFLTAEGGAGAIEYPDVFYTPLGGGDGVNPIHAAFTDARVDATLFGEYRFTSSFAVNATFNYQQNFSGTELPIVGTGTGNTPQVYDMAWQRIQAFLGARFFL